MTKRDEYFMRRAIHLSAEGMNANAGGPFGAVIVKNNEIVAEGYNRVTSTNDPTAHAEIVAIRRACEKIGTAQLDGCTIYTSCEPCPMCLGAIYWAHLKQVFFACDREDAAAVQFDDQFIYDELKKDMGDREIKFVCLLRKEGVKVFEQWANKTNKIAY